MAADLAVRREGIPALVLCDVLALPEPPPCGAPFAVSLPRASSTSQTGASTSWGAPRAPSASGASVQGTSCGPCVGRRTAGASARAACRVPPGIALVRIPEWTMDRGMVVLRVAVRFPDRREAHDQDRRRRYCRRRRARSWRHDREDPGPVLGSSTRTAWREP